MRGLTIEGLGTGLSGIDFNSGGNLAIENCVIQNFATAGISISPTTSSSFSVSNTIASNNVGGGVGVGILVQPSGSAVVTGVLSKVTANNNFDGITVDASLTSGATLNVTIVDSEASFNSFGVSANSHGVATAVMLRNVVASNNIDGLVSGSKYTILRVGHSVVAGNITGVNTSGGGILDSYGDNDIDGNTVDNTGVLTVIATH